MALYAIMLFGKAPADPADASPEELAAHEKAGEETERLGATFVSAYALQPSTTATGVRGDVVTDGPFIDAKEVVAGFFVIDAPDFDTALAVAKANPATQYGGGVELRPVLDGFPKPE
jgi:hypothetical protein